MLECFSHHARKNFNTSSGIFPSTASFIDSSIISTPLSKSSWGMLSGGAILRTLPCFPNVIIINPFSQALQDIFCARLLSGSLVPSFTMSTPISNPLPLTSPIIG
ncbi:104aa long hypothetical protein [Pyrococcus horikoshii OT3]|uniref:Uncharacterized protein n=1 Tax=Pyrococcus horikoshii (strain ATCC 700860 / DSM 12428 / JCM 9974 / NBRC 100139 / OT-3) TaxID=70601 RepID=O57879_PYRHO|nr:104aa long hypothetical protein [Pyrococcus horikoshii OT3]